MTIEEATDLIIERMRDRVGMEWRVEDLEYVMKLLLASGKATDRG